MYMSQLHPKTKMYTYMYMIQLHPKTKMSTYVHDPAPP
jgi:hypothetical protein